MIPNYVVNWAYHIVDVFSYVQLKVVFSIVKYSLIFLMWIWHHPSIPIEDTTIIYIYYFTISILFNDINMDSRLYGWEHVIHIV
jgi:hypothetical protein